MDYINRAINIKELLEKGQVLVIYGPRRVGKTTLVSNFLKEYSKPYLSKTGDDIIARTILSSEDLSRITNLVEGYSLFFIDEAQQIENIGKGLKLIVDSQKEMNVIATGFSMRDTLLLYGGYPQIVTEKNVSRKIELLQEIVSSALFKDIFELEKVKSPQKILDLVKMLAYQIGQPVSAGSLANDLDIDAKTVERYLDLLEKNFIIFRLGAFSRNLRNTIRFKQKYFFWDVGIRNAIINNFNAISGRDDMGGLWENFCVVERIKRNAYIGIEKPNYYFYQSYQNQEIDLIEEMNGYRAFECKWRAGKLSRNKDWKTEYPENPVLVINKDNFTDFF